MSMERVEALLIQMTREEREVLWQRMKRKGVDVGEEVWEGGPEEAYYRARERGGTDVLRAVACQSPFTAYSYAVCVDKGPHDETRAAACGDGWYAYEYAKGVDKCGRDDTRAAASCIPEAAYMYAGYVDQCPHEVTRMGACGVPEWAYEYALYVDLSYHADTWAAVEGTRYEGSYLYELGIPEVA